RRPYAARRSPHAFPTRRSSDLIAHGNMTGSRALITLPLFHCAMLNSAAVPIFIAGGTVVLVQAFDARRTAELIEQYQINMMVLLDRKSTRLNSSHVKSSYDVFC